VRDKTFENWAGNVRVTARDWSSPRSEEQVAAVLAAARHEGRRVKVVGSGHSWSDAAAPEDQAMDLSRLRGVVALDEGRGRVTARAGTTIEELSVWLEARGFALPILGSIAKQTLAGAIATGTHGSSLAHGNLATLVSAMRIVRPAGDQVTLERGDPRLEAAAVHLGALGVVTELSLDVVPRFALSETRRSMPFDALVADLEGIARSAEYVKIWWLPSTGRAVVFRYERVEGPPRRRSELWARIDESLVNGVIFDRLLRVSARFPQTTSVINRGIGAAYFGEGRRVAESRFAFNLAMPPKHREAEWAVPMARAPRALAELAALIERLRLQVNFVTEIRFVKGDALWMSPAHGGDACHIGVYQGESPDLATYFRRTEELAVGWGARPHWGKEFSLGGADVLSRYPRAPDFDALRRESDPDGTLENPFLRRLFGGSTSAGRSTAAR
jgi:L-gulonolactone oxidase